MPRARDEARQEDSTDGHRERRLRPHDGLSSCTASGLGGRVAPASVRAAMPGEAGACPSGYHDAGRVALDSERRR